MQEPYGEGLASHTDAESCVVSREAGHDLDRDTSAVGNGKQRKARSADREPHDYCGRPVL